ncbi:MAG: hypothetical protein J2P28_00270 [Actinobacteria bacterium]|nr:hypothetical protein [Actinomycetota bacterium]MBO0833935.1 hypothetical protein [Actinomycetota bacterium]
MTTQIRSLFSLRRAAQTALDTAPGRRTADWPHAIDAWLAAACGLAVLFVHDVPYMLSHSFWVDEAWVADTVRAPIGMTNALKGTAPLGWLYLLRLVPHFGSADYLRFVPLGFAMLAAAAGYLLGRELRLDRYITGILTGAAVLLVPAMLVRDDLKQYTAEAFATVIVLLLIARMENEWRLRSLVAIAVVGSVGVLFAETLLLTGVAAMASLGLECLVRTHYRRFLEVVGASAGMLIVSLTIYATLIRSQANSSLAAYWRSYYMPTTWHDALPWLHRRLTELAPYAGFKPLILDAVLAAAGIAALIWLRRVALAAMFPITLAIVIIASAAERYPFADLRTSTFWLVIPPVLTAIAVAAAGRLAGRVDRRAPALVAAAALALWVFATYPSIRSHPLPSEDPQSQIAYLNRHFRPGDVVVVNPAASYAFAYYYPATPSFPKAAVTNGFVVSYPSRPWIVILTNRQPADIVSGLAAARAQIAAEPADHRGRIWIIRSHQILAEIRTWQHLLAGQPVQIIPVGSEPILLYRYRSPGSVASAAQG